jgi:hypothetical protein
MAPFNILQSILIFTIVAIPTLILGGAYRALAETGNPSEFSFTGSQELFF